MTQSSTVLPDLDRKRASAWIATLSLAVATALVAACSGVESTNESESNLSEPGRWSIPADVKAVGARVRLDYDAAPLWTGAAGCGGKLLVGSKKLGTFLTTSFDGIDSIGGYACRRNTADGSRMSVHGTGRALDVMIPRVGGKADNTKGDKIANWLILNAQRIGVQLIIWDKTIWRANGTNDGVYGGPHPHDDHLHVELTIEAGKAMTAWFSDMNLGDGGMADASDAARDSSTTTRDAGSDAPTTTVDASTDSGTTTPIDAGPAPTPDAGTTEPEEPKEEPKEPTTTGTSSDSGYEVPENEEETEPDDSVGTSKSNRKSPSSSDDDLDAPASSCTTTAAPRVPAGAFAGGLVLALGFLVRRRRR